MHTCTHTHTHAVQEQGFISSETIDSTHRDVFKCHQAAEMIRQIKRLFVQRAVCLPFVLQHLIKWRHAEKEPKALVLPIHTRTLSYSSMAFTCHICNEVCVVAYVYVYVYSI